MFTKLAKRLRRRKKLPPIEDTAHNRFLAEVLEEILKTQPDRVTVNFQGKSSSNFLGIPSYKPVALSLEKSDVPKKRKRFWFF